MEALDMKVEHDPEALLPYAAVIRNDKKAGWVVARFEQKEHADLFVSVVIVTELRKVLGDERFNAMAAYLLQGQHSLAS